MITIQKSTMRDFFAASNIDSFIEQYANESSIENVGKINPDKENYLRMDECGLLTVFIAKDDDLMIGYIVLIHSIIPHYTKKIITTESFFVLPEFRHTGIGLRLLKIAEKYGIEIGACGIFISAPAEGKLSKVLSRKKGYQLTNSVFFKGFSDE